LAVFKCKMCGGDVEVAPNKTFGSCEYCGSSMTFPRLGDEQRTAAFNRGNHFRRVGEFDKALAVYERIVREDDTDAEAHWCCALCRFGIEYVEDPVSYEYIPTCHRASFDSFLEDVDYLAAVEHSDGVTRRQYQKDAARIAEVQRGILLTSQNTEPYDVFICYKETDEAGNRTRDSILAQEIYYQLTEQGRKVFFARITLEDVAGAQYEPYIFAALNSATVMVVVGTKPEHLNAVWVKNEWSRFLTMMKKDHRKLLLPCYRDMDPYDLPDQLSVLQSYDMAKIGFIQDLTRGINKVLEAEKKPEIVKETVVVQPGAASAPASAPLMKRAFLFLEDGDWKSADEYSEKVLDMDPENALGYLGKLMAELQVKNRASLKNQAKPFDHSNNYQKAIRFADEKLKAELTGCIEYINTRNENARLEGIYSQAKAAMAGASTENAYKDAASIFHSIRDFRDSAVLMKICSDNADTIHKDAILAAGIGKMDRLDRMNRLDISSYEKAIELFTSISGWKNADELVITCQEKIAEIKEREEKERLEWERIAEEERRLEKPKMITAIVIAATIVIAILVIRLMTQVIIPNGKYNDAIALMDAGNLDDAYSAFIELGDYKDAANKAGDIRLQVIKDQLKNIKVGSHIIFGVYEQDNNTANGKEEIEWLVLEVNDGKALVISKYALDCKQYNTSRTTVTWETCSLRKWLNNDFINAVFSAEEKAMIPTVTVSADKNPEYSTKPGNATQDQVFLLSITEANKYFSVDREKWCEPTDYAVANGAYVSSSNGNCWWWLRSPGYGQDRAASVFSDGDVDEYGDNVNYDDGAVRPALWIDLNS